MKHIFVGSSDFSVCSREGKSRGIPGWNKHCRELHAKAREHYLNWVEGGRPRFGSLFADMRSSRSSFKCALNFCKNNEQRIRKQNLADSFIDSNKKNYWNEIKKLNRCNKVKSTTCIDNKSDIDEIIDIFKCKYKNILDDVNSQVTPDNYDVILDRLRNKEQLYSCHIFKHTLDNAIDKLKPGLGWDNVHSNHLKFSGTEFRVTLCKLFSAFLCHGYAPPSLIRGEITPIIKNNLGNKNSSNNYRPVMNSSNIFKLLEYCLLPYLNRHLKINSRQFAYRSGAGCMTSGAILKETVAQYNAKRSNIHCCMIDYSLAYDKINHRILLSKLIESDLPRNIILLIKNICENSYIGIRFNNVCSESDFKIGNGVRQGGVCSGLMFVYYVNDILDVVSRENSGCVLGTYRVNILAYADDVSLLAPSRSALQKLIDVVYRMSVELCLTINVRKTQYIVFLYDLKKRTSDFNVSMNNVVVNRVYECKYLGIYFDDELSLRRDVEKCHNNFLRQFNSMYYKFNFVNKDQLVFLFESFCTSFYGSDLWNDGLLKPNMFKNIATTYHRALKRVVGLSPYHNNHDAASLSGTLLFKHLVSSRVVSFLFRLIGNKSSCMIDLKGHFRNNSIMSKNVKAFFREKYGLNFLYDNELCAIKARISFVQRTEESSGYNPYLYIRM